MPLSSPSLIAVVVVAVVVTVGVVVDNTVNGRDGLPWETLQKDEIFTIADIATDSKTLQGEPLAIHWPDRPIELQTFTRMFVCLLIFFSVCVCVFVCLFVCLLVCLCVNLRHHHRL